MPNLDGVKWLIRATSSTQQRNPLTGSLSRKVYIMSKFKIAALVSWFFSGILFGFQAIEALIGSQGKMVWKKLTLMNVVGESHFNWIKGMSEGGIHNAVQYIATMPLYLLLFCVGIIFFILNRLTFKL
jgi:hypothetical protein